jgi:hypothetical protein
MTKAGETASDKLGEFSEEEIAQRRDAAIRRALNTPPKPNSEYVGKSERAKARPSRRVQKGEK